MPTKEPTDKILTRARKAANAGDYPGAVAAFAQVLTRFPSNKRALQGMAALKTTALPQMRTAARKAQEERRWSDAEAQLRAACTLAPEEIDLRLALASCLLDQLNAPAALAATFGTWMAVCDQTRVHTPGIGPNRRPPGRIRTAGRA